MQWENFSHVCLQTRRMFCVGLLQRLVQEGSLALARMHLRKNLLQLMCRSWVRGRGRAWALVCLCGGREGGRERERMSTVRANLRDLYLSLPPSSPPLSWVCVHLLCAEWQEIERYRAVQRDRQRRTKMVSLLDHLCHP